MLKMIKKCSQEEVDNYKWYAGGRYADEEDIYENIHVWYDEHHNKHIIDDDCNEYKEV